MSFPSLARLRSRQAFRELVGILRVFAFPLRKVVPDILNLLSKGLALGSVRIKWPRSQAAWIRPTNRVVSNIRVRINPTLQTDRITFDVPPRARVIVSEVVVIEPRLLIIVLPRKSKVVGYLR